MIRTVVVLGSIAAVLLSLQYIGVYPIAPGYPVEIEEAVGSHPSGCKNVLHTDVENIQCYLELRIPTDTCQLVAKLSTGDSLSVILLDSDSISQWIAICKPNKNQTARDKFTWPSGADVILSTPGSYAANLKLEDWLVYMTDKPFDSQFRTQWRNWWFMISLVLVGLAAISVAASAHKTWPSRTTLTGFSPEVCKSGIIETLSNAWPNKQERKLLKKYLHHFELNGISPSALIRKNVDKKERVKHYRLWFDGIIEYCSMLEYYTTTFDTSIARFQSVAAGKPPEPEHGGQDSE